MKEYTNFDKALAELKLAELSLDELENLKERLELLNQDIQTEFDKANKHAKEKLAAFMVRGLECLIEISIDDLELMKDILGDKAEALQDYISDVSKHLN